MDSTVNSLLQVYSQVSFTKVLGPSNRYALWVQGCPFRCKECLAPNSLDFSGGNEVSVSKILKEVYAVKGLEGITISGGEPFSQARSLFILASNLKEKGYGVIVYTGYTYNSLQKMAVKDGNILAFLNQIDLLIDGPYVSSKNDGISLRGSSNQRLNFLTSRYKAVAKHYYGQTVRQVELHSQDDGLMLVGIPGKEVMKKLTVG